MSVKQEETSLKWQSGRSMVEMIGVLSVIGVLTIGGITGIKYALQVHAENETVNDFNVAVAGAKTLGLEFADKGPVLVNQIVSVPEQNMRDDYYFTTNTISPVMVNVEQNGYTVQIAGISKVVCEQIKYGEYGETCAMIGKKYEADACGLFADVDCEKFVNVKDPSSRKSALQLEENFDINFSDAAEKYSSLILYFGSSGMQLSSDKSDSDMGDGGPGGPEPYPSDPPDVPPVYPPVCTPNTPFITGTRVQHESCCRDAGGLWSRKGNICCMGSTCEYITEENGAWVKKPGVCGAFRFLENQLDDENCKDPYCRSLTGNDLNNNKDCCEFLGYKYLNGTCCEVKDDILSGNDANGNSSPSCMVCNNNPCPNGKMAVAIITTGQCCCDVEDQNAPGQVNGKCCENACKLRNIFCRVENNTCCEVDKNGQLTGVDYANNKTNNCSPCKQMCPDGSRPEFIDGVCCCGAVDEQGNANKTCCTDDGGSWHETEGVCCRGAVDEQGNANKTCCTESGGSWHETETDRVCCQGSCTWNETTKACCSNGFRCNDGKTQGTQRCILCKRGEKAVSTVKNGKDITLCCVLNSPRGYDSASPRPAVLPYENACCTDAGGLNEKGICCKPNSSINLEDGKRNNICCDLVDGEWKGSYCCIKWSWQFVKEGGGMCHKPSSK